MTDENQSSQSSFNRVLDRPYDEAQDGLFSSEPHDFGFELDSFQKHAISAIKREENILVTAHTGSGKTVPAIFGIADSLKIKKLFILHLSNHFPIKNYLNLNGNFPMLEFSLEISNSILIAMRHYDY